VKKTSKKKDTVTTFSAFAEQRQKCGMPQRQDKRKKASNSHPRIRRSKNMAQRIILVAPKSIRTRADCWETHYKTTKDERIIYLKCSRWLYGKKQMH